MNLIKTINIENLIYEIREKQVMLDSNLINLYRVETKRINKAVRRNTKKFPERYSFILREDEINILCLQIIILNQGLYQEFLQKLFQC